jgi:hypothetical protein
MSNHDLVISNDTGINVRTDIQGAVQALGTNFQGAVPLAIYPCQIWADSGTGLLKIRNIANTAWITLGALDTANFGHLPLTGGALAGPGNLTIGGTLGVTGVTTFTLSPVGPTPAVADNSTKLATTAFVAAALGGGGGGPGYLPLTGGVLTGPGNLTVSGTLAVTGQATFSQSPVVAPASGNSLLTLNAANVTGNQKDLIGQAGGLNRWILQVGNGAAESSGNLGNDFAILRYNDAGTFIDAPLTISRASAQATFASDINRDGAAGSFRQVFFRSSGSIRWTWYVDATAEGGSNAGSNMGLNCSTDAGAFLGTVYSIVRSTQIVTFAKAIVNGPSDRTLKENIAPLKDSLDKVLALQGVSFNMIDDESKRRQIGLVAQDVAAVVPEVLQEFQTTDADGKAGEPKLALDYSKLTALLIEACKELAGRVTTLEAKLAGMTTT